MQQGDAGCGAYPGDDRDSCVFPAKGSVLDGIGGEMSPVYRPQDPNGQHDEDDKENEVAISEELPDDHVRQADEEEDEQHAEDEIGYVQKGRRKIVSAASVRDIINKADEGICDANKKAGHHGPVSGRE